MKKKLLPLAMLAGLAGAVGTAQAAHVNPDGLGQVLIYPYYTTLDGQHTDIHLVNTTNKTKAIKVRFLEGQNSREVRDFHLYLSAYDHWSGVITSTGEGDSKVALFRTGDTSCTVPTIPQAGVPFTNIAYTSDKGTNSLSRTLEGYVEIIEMGELGEEDDAGNVTEYGVRVANFDPAHAAKHINGVPKDCSALVKAWTAGGNGNGQWLGGANATTVNIQPGTGGLYGFASVFNVAEGTSATYSATAIANFNTLDVLHAPTGNTRPSLIDIGIPTAVGSTTVSVVDGASVFNDSFDVTSTNEADPVSALLTRATLKNDYVTDAGLNAETDWVVTFPTKRFYMIDDVRNAAGVVTTSNQALRRPFTSEFTANMACEHIEVGYYDREEGSVNIVTEPVFSPAPPTGSTSWELCSEVNVITFNDSNILGSSLRYGLSLEDGFDNGWATIDFTQTASATANPRTVIGDAYTYAGLPVAGFAVIKYSNGALAGGVLSNYAGVVEHKYTRQITTNTP
ncbi:hypothetical protein [Cellvibrio polysaccharolyticus]|uniref:Uncharacterized protein n=1 Tax=Cellvibrio polysaccharolyticus TaxID=2082724 RepID=A0A928V4Y0_9GAMM|nr:hypothetical protein [Cellvibrio polysaccharolyticus]MBE8718876.1 hypothetical protein [Cellvibrio polysaccharolyticus]